MAGKGEVRLIERCGLRVLYRCPCGEVIEFLCLGGSEVCPGCHEVYIVRVIVGRVKKKKVSPA